MDLKSLSDSELVCLRDAIVKNEKDESKAVFKKVLEVKNTEDNPLVLKENEKPYSADRLKKAIFKVLNITKKRLKDELENQMTNDKISGLKSVESKGVAEFIDKMISFIDFEPLRNIVNAIVKNNYMKGNDNAERELDQNVIPNKHAIDFLQDYTFDNVKSIKEDTINKLKSTLQRGMINNEPLNVLKDNITKVFDVDENRATAIARTETNRAENQGKLQAYKSVEDSGEWNKWILMTDDNRTSDISKALHVKYGSEEQAIPLNENFKARVKSGNKIIEVNQSSPPFHVNERDLLMFVHKSDIQKKSLKKQLKQKSVIDARLDIEMLKKQEALMKEKSALLKKIKMGMESDGT